MKYFTAAVGISSLISLTIAHSTVGHLIVNGTDTGLWKHVLDVAPWTGLNNPLPPPENQYGKIIPQRPEDLSTSNITCGRNAFDSLAKTEIADIIAGETIGFRNMQAIEGGNPGIGGIFYHPGPAQIWLSRAPNDDLKSYKGTGDWFKIGVAGPANNTNWKLQHTVDYNFTTPATTPPGAYLLRFELFMPTTYHYHQWYINCALVRIHSPPNVTPGVPTGFLRFPGEGGKWPYDPEDPGITLPYNQGDEVPPNDKRLLQYKPPGPLVWFG